MKMSSDHILHEDDLDKYAPPEHTGTVNVRLADRRFCDNFEMVLGRLEPGAEAHRHHHEHEYQAMYVLKGTASITLGDSAPVDCGPGTVVRIPPGLDHYLVNDGGETLEVMIVYSPPLAPREDTPVRSAPT
jgi:quercetin dioxygenase-like cupin family protein